MLSVFGFGFFHGFDLCNFFGFSRSTLVRFLFWKITLQSIFQIYEIADGNLAYRNLLVIQGKMLPFFFRFLLHFSLVTLSDVGDGLSWNEFRGNTATTHKSYLFCCWLLLLFSFLSYEQLYKSHAWSPECPFWSFSWP